MQISKQIALKGAKIIDGLGGEAQVKTILIKDGIISGICQEIICPEGYEEINFSGKYIMPGMIEMHGHFYANRIGYCDDVLKEFTKLYLAGGVTTVRSAAEKEPEKVFAYRDSINKGKLTGPRILTAGYYINRLSEEMKSQPAGWMGPRETLEELIELYNSQKDKIDQVKVYNTMPAEWIKKICELAHADGLKVYGHIGKSTAKDAILAGIDGLEHGPFNMPEFYEDNGKFSFERLTSFDPDSRLSEELIELIVKNNIAITPTNSIIATDGKKVTERIEKNNIYRFFGGTELIKQKQRRDESDLNIRKTTIQDDFMRRSSKFIYKMYKSGGKIFCGTDPVYTPIIPGYGLVWEAESLRECGIPNDYIIRALTSEAAKELGVFNITGSVSIGKQADLIVLDNDPTENISNLSSVKKVFKSGVEYDTEEIRKSLEGCFDRVFED